MKKLTLTTLVLPLWFVFSTSGRADTYDYELGMSYAGTETYTNSSVVFGTLPPVTIMVDSDSDSDDIAVFGSWYFDGVTATTGPRSRAAFIGRASAISLSYSRGSGDTTTAITSSDPSFPSSIETSELSTDNISASLRWVWPESGWYGLATLATGDANIDSPSGSASFSGHAYGLGVGKYIGSQTSIDLTIMRSETDASGFVIGGTSSSTEAAIALTHIGSLGQTWQYGVDIALNTTSAGSSNGSFDIVLSLYPSRNFAFGLEVNGAVQDIANERVIYDLVASWFPSERIELAAGYGWTSIDEPADTDFNQDSFRLGANIRF